MKFCARYRTVQRICNQIRKQCNLELVVERFSRGSCAGTSKSERRQAILTSCLGHRSLASVPMKGMLFPSLDWSCLPLTIDTEAALFALVTKQLPLYIQSDRKWKNEHELCLCYHELFTVCSLTAFIKESIMYYGTLEEGGMENFLLKTNMGR
jgi:hypothetical protein